MMNERHTELALKALAGKATSAERNELDSALANNPALKDEFELLRVNTAFAKEFLPVVAALETTTGEFPAYARERLQTKVRETLGRPSVRGRSWARRLFVVLAPATVVVVLLVMLILPSDKQPLIQLAMLDTVGQTRGQTTNGVKVLQERWKGETVRVFSAPQELLLWEKNWPKSKVPVAKVGFDPAAAEVRVLVRSGDREIRKIIPVQEDLSAALNQAEAFIKEQTTK